MIDDFQVEPAVFWGAARRTRPPRSARPGSHPQPPSAIDGPGRDPGSPIVRHRSKSIFVASSSRSAITDPQPFHQERAQRHRRSSCAIRRCSNLNPTPGLDAAHCPGCRRPSPSRTPRRPSPAVIASPSPCHSNQASPPLSSSTSAPAAGPPRPCRRGRGADPGQGHPALVHVPVHGGGGVPKLRVRHRGQRRQLRADDRSGKVERLIPDHQVGGEPAPRPGGAGDEPQAAYPPAAPPPGRSGDDDRGRSQSRCFVAVRGRNPLDATRRNIHVHARPLFDLPTLPDVLQARAHRGGPAF